MKMDSQEQDLNTILYHLNTIDKFKSGCKNTGEMSSARNSDLFEVSPNVDSKYIMMDDPFDYN